MPSAMVGNNPAQSASPDLGNGSQSETMKQFLGVVEKKVRNMEKKKSKLDDYQAKKDKGENLNQDQLEALAKYQEIQNNLEFARELQKSFLALGQEIQKAGKKVARRELLQKEELEQQRLKTVLELQFILDQLGDDHVRQDLKQPQDSPLLTEAELTSLDDFYKLVGPERNYDFRLTNQYEEASVHLWELLEGKNKPVAGTSYKALKDILDKVLLSGYFDQPQTHQNGTCEEDKGEEKETVEAEAIPEEKPAEPEGVATETFAESIKVETTEFVNTQFIPEATYSSTDKEQAEEWSVEAQLVSSLQHPPPPVARLAPEPPAPVNHVAPVPQPDPVVRKQVVQDLMAQLQGTYNFMQDSMLEFDGQALDPAIVSAQPMKPVQTLDLQQMTSPHSESRLPQMTSVTGPQDSSQVFNLNASGPPAGESQEDVLKTQSQFPGSYGQGFGHTDGSVDQSDIPQEALQSVVSGFQSQSQAVPTPGHEDSSAGAGFGPSGQSFYNSRAAPRGGPRSSRGGVLNGYRGSSNGFRGAYEGYRPPFANAPSPGYGQNQYNTPRDFSNATYQREGYQQGYKRGSGQGPRGLSRGNVQAMRS